MADLLSESSRGVVSNLLRQPGGFEGFGSGGLPDPGERVDADRDREQQSVVFALCCLDAVGLTNPEPGFRDVCDHVSVLLDLVFVIDEVALRLQITSVREIYREAVPDADERLLDRR